jgi:hypothetical protein
MNRLFAVALYVHAHFLHAVTYRFGVAEVAIASAVNLNTFTATSTATFHGCAPHPQS